MENKTLKELYRELNPEIYHYGVLGMRWGVRRFQPYSLIPRKSGEGGKEIGAAKKASKSSSGSGGDVSSKVSKKTRSQKSREAKEHYKQQEQQELKTAKQRAAEKERILKSGTATEINSIKEQLTYNELNNAINRINTEKRLAELVAEENPSTVRKITRELDKANEVVNKGLDYKKTIDSVKKEVTSYQKKKKEDEQWKYVRDEKNLEDILANSNKYSAKLLQEANQHKEQQDKLQKKVDAKKK